MKNSWWLAWRLFRRDIREGEPRIMALALILAVAAVVAVSFFNDRMQRGLAAQANQLIAADLLLRSDQPVPDEVVQQAEQEGLQWARLVQLPTVVFDDRDESMLISLKAVSDAYPLRGELRLGAPGEAVRTHRGAPEPGTVWVDSNMQQKMALELGTRLYLGAIEVTVADIIRFEPDRSGGLFALSPRVMMNVQDLPRAELIAPGSRVRYRLQLAGERDALDRMGDWLQAHEQADSWRVLDVREARPETRAALDRLQRFFGLASLLTVLVAGAAVAISAQSFSRRQADAVAVYRCFGASSQRILGVTLRWLALLTLLSVALGLLVGWGIQTVASAWVGAALGLPLPWPGPMPALIGVLTGAICTLGFALPPVLSLREVPVIRVLRKQASAPSRSAVALAGFALLAMAVMVVIQAANLTLATIVIIVMTLAPLLLYGIARGVVALLRRPGGGLTPGWRFGLGSFARRGKVSALQAAALSLGLLCLAILTLLVRNLLDTWANELPEDAPNFFVINIQPQQRAGFEADISPLLDSPATYYPVIRGRLTADSALVDEDDDDDDGGRRGFNLTWSDTPNENETVDGRWWTPEEGAARPLFSVEEEMLEEMGKEVGDSLSFTVAGERVEGQIAHARSVQWESLRPNFFVIGSSAALADMPATWMTAVSLPETQVSNFYRLARDYPGVSLLSVTDILNRVRELLDQSSMAVRAVFSFTLLAGLLVMVAAIRSTRESRGREVALLRAFGQSRAKLRSAVLAEYLLVGLLAALIGCLLAQLAAWAIAFWVFELPLSVDVTGWIILVAGCAAGTMAAGWWAMRKLLRTPPQRILQAE